MCWRHSVISGSIVEFHGCKRLSGLSKFRDANCIVGIRVCVYGCRKYVSSVDRQGANVRSRELFMCFKVDDDQICVCFKYWDKVYLSSSRAGHVERLDLCQL
jgi:hypothetical protein